MRLTHEPTAGQGWGAQILPSAGFANLLSDLFLILEGYFSSLKLAY
jgi:hypothetical protein